MGFIVGGAAQGAPATARRLDLACRFFWEVGLPAVEAGFAAYVDRIAGGVLSAADDCCTSDSSIEETAGPVFQLFLNSRDYSSAGPRMQAALSGLPYCYEGIPTAVQVYSIDDFFRAHTSCGGSTGFASAPQSAADWLAIPEACLFDLTRGQIFYDPSGEVTRRRQEFLSYYPTEVWLARLSETIRECSRCEQSMLQSLACEDFYTSQLMWWKFAEAAMKTAFVLSRKYAPGPKLLFGEFCSLPSVPVEAVHSLWEGQGDCLSRTDLVSEIAAAYGRWLQMLGFRVSYTSSRPTFAELVDSIAASSTVVASVPVQWSVEILRA